MKWKKKCEYTTINPYPFYIRFDLIDYYTFNVQLSTKVFSLTWIVYLNYIICIIYITM